MRSRSVPALIAFRLSDLDARRLAMVAALDATSKSQIARDAIRAAIRERLIRYANQDGDAAASPTVAHVEARELEEEIVNHARFNPR